MIPLPMTCAGGGCGYSVVGGDRHMRSYQVTDLVHRSRFRMPRHHLPRAPKFCCGSAPRVFAIVICTFGKAATI